jgi:two-component system chemotaxis response regulator CheB
MKPIRVLIVDDSALVRKMLREILDSDPDIEVAGHAGDAYVARQKIKKLNPDVLTLDIEMPKMDGISFLKNIMRLRPMPVVMVSSLTQHGAAATLEALELGAIDYVSKPKIDFKNTIEQYADEIIAKVKMAAGARVRPLEQRAHRTRVPARKPARTALPQVSEGPFELIAVGASTGGTEAIRELLEQLPVESPGVVMVQHIPREFSGAFAERLNNCSALTVKEAEEGDRIQPGRGYVAPGGLHLAVEKDADGYRCRLEDSDKVNQHRPSADVLFRSVAEAAGPRAMGILLTGMGSDGALGMQELHWAGSTTVAQDESTSVVWGMPREAIHLGCVDEVLPLPDIPERIQAMLAETAAARG